MMIKIEDISSPFELEVWVNYQGDRYMSFTGTCFMLTPFFECMEPTGVIYQETEGRAFPTPNLARIPQRLYTDGQMLSAGHVPRVSPLTPQPTQGQEQVNSEIPIYHMHVKRVYVDNEGVLLYQNQGGVVYKTLIFHGYEYPPETTLHVYETKGITTINIYDEWDNLYTVAYKDQLGHYTWQGRSVFERRGPPSWTYGEPVAIARPREKDVNAFTPRYMEPIYPSNADKHLHPQYVSRDYSGRIGRPMHSHGDESRIYMDESGGNMVNEGPHMPYEQKPNLRKKLHQTRGKKDKTRDKKLRPTYLQKFSKKFDGTGDPYDHVAQFRQLVFAEGVTTCTLWCKDLV